MANKKKQTRTQLGKLPPSYRFFLNPYSDVRFTNCPQCTSKMHQRKLPLVIHVDPIATCSLPTRTISSSYSYPSLPSKSQKLLATITW